MGEIDYKAIAASALQRAELLLGEWLGGHRVGSEWHAERRMNGGPGDSWKVNLITGKWLHGASGEGGLDLISLFARRNNLDQRPAALEVGRQCGYTNGAVPVLPARAPAGAPCEIIPDNAPPLSPHPKYGDPTAVYRYGDDFWVSRYEYVDQSGRHAKAFQQWTWRSGKWSAKGFPAPRLIYNIVEVSRYGERPILIVEGEKCVEAGRPILSDFVLTSWAGGAGSVLKNDWEPLKGRDVTLWPDADDSGKKAMRELAALLFASCRRVRLLDVTGMPEGWDLADAIGAHWDAPKIEQFLSQKAREVHAPAPVLPMTPAPVVSASVPVTWHSLGLDLAQSGMPHPTLANASLIVRMHPDYAGRIWFDSFRKQIRHTLRGGVEGAWTDSDLRALTARIQQQLSLPKFNMNLMQDAVAHAADISVRNSLTDWLGALKWDGTERLDTWLSDCLGVERNEYNDAVARNWAIAMIARAYVPGCKMDNMPVLEGIQGLSKTTFLEVLGHPWYKALPMAFGDKDFMQAMQGAWLIEIPDMTGFSRREHTHILAIITIREDSYRASYGRYVEEHPRVAIFGATSEDDDYLTDPRGRRRYWPLRCTYIDIDVLRAQREQIFAEALIKYRAGARWYEMPKQAEEEQIARVQSDPWNERVVDFLRTIEGTEAKITAAQILSRVIEVPMGQQDRSLVARVTRILREEGWMRARSCLGRWWVPAKKELPPLDGVARGRRRNLSVIGIQEPHDPVGE